MKSLFSLPKHKVFEYKPMYYDPEKERIEQRRKELGLTADTEKLAGSGAMIRQGFMRARHDEFIQQMEDDRRKQRVRTLTLAILLGVFMYLLLSGALNSLVSLFMRS
ncbi:MAG: hypothetical protein II951_07090 [Bacteroidales bacterium]|nr:hypothetical protein [Bacteroidales bacterium]